MLHARHKEIYSKVPAVLHLELLTRQLEACYFSLHPDSNPVCFVTKVGINVEFNIPYSLIPSALGRYSSLADSDHGFFFIPSEYKETENHNPKANDLYSAKHEARVLEAVATVVQVSVLNILCTM
jgi:hypothetical protein